MFAVIKIVYKKPSGTKKLIKPKPECRLNKIKINRSHYYELTVTAYSKKINWKKVFKTVNVTDVPIIMPNSHTLPEDVYIKQFTEQNYKNTVLVNCALRYFDKNSKIFVVDGDTDNHELLLKLLGFFKEVCICTGAEEKYSDLMTKAQTQLGCAPIFCENLKLIDQADGVINLSDKDSIQHKTVFGTGGYTFLSTDVLLPKSIQRIIPRNINPYIFAAALCELCGVNGLKEVTAIKLTDCNTKNIIKINTI